MADFTCDDSPIVETILFDEHFECLESLISTTEKHLDFMHGLKGIPISDANVKWYCLGKGFNEARIDLLLAGRRFRISPVRDP